LVAASAKKFAEQHIRPKCNGNGIEAQPFPVEGIQEGRGNGFMGEFWFVELVAGLGYHE